MLMQEVWACDGCKGRRYYSFVDTKVNDLQDSLLSS